MITKITETRKDRRRWTTLDFSFRWECKFELKYQLLGHLRFPTSQAPNFLLHAGAVLIDTVKLKARFLAHVAILQCLKPGWSVRIQQNVNVESNGSGFRLKCALFDALQSFTGKLCNKNACTGLLLLSNMTLQCWEHPTEFQQQRMKIFLWCRGCWHSALWKREHRWGNTMPTSHQ